VTNTFKTGALSIVKKIDGAGAESYGAGPFTAQAVCTYQADGETKTIDLPNGGAVLLSQANGYRAEIDNLIVGADCTVKETDAAGADTTTIAPVGGAVTITGDQQSPVTVTITNTFKAGNLTVTKQVAGDGAKKYGTGTFDFTAVCTWPKGTGAQGAGGTQTTNFELSDGETKTLGLYPIGTECTVSEETTGGATKHTLEVTDTPVALPGVTEGLGLSGATGTADASGSANDASSSQEEIRIPDAVDAQKPSTTGLVATNTFDTANLTIVKQRVGVGAAAYGTGTFTAKAVCTYDRDGEKTDIELPDDGTVKLNQENGYRATIRGLIQGADCTVTETDRGQATSVSVSDGGQLSVSADNAKNVVTITNHFDTAPPTGGTELPRTGAFWQLPTLGALLLLLGAGGLLLAWFRRRRG
jgi:LPXTG-motif cell wall-anchored protein